MADAQKPEVQKVVAREGDVRVAVGDALGFAIGIEGLLVRIQRFVASARDWLTPRSGCC